MHTAERTVPRRLRRVTLQYTPGTRCRGRGKQSKEPLDIWPQKGQLIRCRVTAVGGGVSWCGGGTSLGEVHRLGGK